MDAFYANAELIREPRLKGLPVAVGGRRATAPLPGQLFPTLAQYQGRGVLTTANYEARALGLHSAMPTMRAAKIAPHVILLPADFEWYKTLSRNFKAAVRTLAPCIEDRGIDEIYLDITEETGGNFDAALALARQLKLAVSQATGGMTCSVGLSENKLTSKICSDLQKPDGISIVPPWLFQEIIWPLPVGKISGVGPKAQEKLNVQGVSTIAQLASQAVADLQNQFGESYGLWLHRSANGIDPREVTLYSEPKSISRENTFEQDMHVRRERDALSTILQALASKLALDLARKGRVARTVGIKVRFADFQSLTRDITPGHAISTVYDILQAARQCLKKVPFQSTGHSSRIRLLGIKATHLLPIDQTGTFNAGVKHTSIQRSDQAKHAAQLELWPTDAP